MSDNPFYNFRQTVTEADIKNVREIAESTGFFYKDEVEIAVELIEERLEKGLEESTYHFLFAELEGKTVGYTCFGKIPCTKQSYDIYWIGVHESMRGKGLGKLLIIKTENIIGELGGNGIFLETSSREKYLPTRNFYFKCSYQVEKQIKDFYDYGDDKMIFVKRLRDKVY